MLSIECRHVSRTQDITGAGIYFIFLVPLFITKQLLFLVLISHSFPWSNPILFSHFVNVLYAPHRTSAQVLLQSVGSQKL